MLNKFLFAGLLATSALTMTSPATAGYDEEKGQLSVSIRKLKYGYMNGEVTLNDGTKLSVTKPSYASEPNFTTLDKDQKLTTPVTSNTAHFVQETPGSTIAVFQGYVKKYNASTQVLEDDLTQPIYKNELMSGTRFFDLDVKIISTKKLSEPKSEVKKIDVNNNSIVQIKEKTQILTISSKEGVLEEKKPSIETKVSLEKTEKESLPVAQVKMLYGSLVIRLEDLKKAAKSGTLKTNLGTMTFAIFGPYGDDTASNLNFLFGTMDELYLHSVTKTDSQETFRFDYNAGPGRWNESLKMWENDAAPYAVSVTLKKDVEEKK
ncbi:hypothetical protein Bealeia1_01190 [Candidatus Bealeia paramacronuclearis]|uniref:Uncharacterized protein n=1 Tax=Candidatus Bealeia paramacronuclearis TaxID=1921001 RepID=A0ABZ2C3F9_9PROT|nr:hypothetical protein [Candidatus Bealeia paramacronuclearis]